MSLNNSIARTIKSLLQDSVIRIPFFVSTLKSTSTVAILLQTQAKTISSNKPIKMQKIAQQQQINLEQTVNKFMNERGVIGHQWKLYYEKDIGYKSVIIQFQSIQFSQKFYFKYAKNYDKTLLNENNRQNYRKQLNQTQYNIYFCKDITSSGINMQQVLYSLGKISVQIPQSSFLRNFIKQVAKLIVVEGIRGQQQLLKYGPFILSATFSQNLLDFMDPKFLSSQSTYYRWRVYSYLQGDGQHNYRQDPFQITFDGPIFYPPNQLSQKYMYKILNHQQRQYVTKLLQSISSRKFHIEQAMSFCINKINSAIQICCIISICIVQSCKKLSDEQNKTNRTNEIKHLIGLFYLISDILFNSVSTTYRDVFTVILPSLLEKLPTIPELNIKIQEVIQTWSKKFILQDQFIRGIMLSVKKQLPTMKPLGMQQMTRSQHECYKKLIKIQTPYQIQELCWKYGIGFSLQRIAQSYRNLAAVMAQDHKNQQINQMQPQTGAYDGQSITDKDLLKIKLKSCRVISCQDIAIKYLFDKQRSGRDISYQKD